MARGACAAARQGLGRSVVAGHGGVRDPDPVPAVRSIPVARPVDIEPPAATCRAAPLPRDRGRVGCVCTRHTLARDVSVRPLGVARRLALRPRQSPLGSPNTDPLPYPRAAMPLPDHLKKLLD